MAQGRLGGKVAIITGAGSASGGRRPGASPTKEPASSAPTSAVTSATSPAGLGDVALAMHVDVTNAADVQRMVATTVDRFGRVDVLLNNAGFRRATRGPGRYRWRGGANPPNWPPPHYFSPAMKRRSSPAPRWRWKVGTRRAARWSANHAKRTSVARHDLSSAQPRRGYGARHRDQRPVVSRPARGRSPHGRA